MIPVAQQIEPKDFDVRVRKPGKKFLASTPNPTSKEFKKHEYWRDALNDLFAAYKGICAYTCTYLPKGSVDHFSPKSRFPNLAYEWSNYRLSNAIVNSYKGDSIDVIDPFIVQSGWFIIEFPSCLIRPAEGLSPIVTKQIQRSIDILKLNDYDFFVQERSDIMVDYADGNVSLQYLTSKYPFIASEIIRQGIQNTTSTIFKRRSK